MGSAMGDGAAVLSTLDQLDLNDWVLVNKEDWWHTEVHRYGLPPASFLTAHEPDGVALSDAPTLGEDLPGVRFAEQVLKFYEDAVGFHAPICPSTYPFVLAEPPLPPERSPEAVEHANKAAWATVVSQLDEDEDDGFWNPSMSSSISTLRSTSVDLTSDSGVSAEYDPMPSTPRAAEPPVLVQDHIESSARPSSPAVDFTFPTLNTTPIVEITRDDDGFIVPKKDKETKLPSIPLDDLLPPFLLESVAKAKSSTKSKTRTMVDKLRSSNRDAPAEDTPTPSIHDLSFIKPRLGATLDADEDDAGWIGAPTLPPAQGSDSLMALANRARNAFLQGLKRGKAVEIVLATPPSKVGSKSKPRGDQTPSDKDGWIEYPSLDTPGKTKLTATKDTMARRSPSKRAPSNSNNHRRTTSHAPSPTVPQLVSTHRPSTSGTFVFPPPPPVSQGQWTGSMAPPTQMFAVVPPPFFRAPPPQALMRPAPQPTPSAGWFVPSPPVMRHPPVQHPMHPPAYHKVPHVIA
ncbi:hypothetical protein DL96DRAFT_1600785 [Flagelloscypha sp. PMI_526]|nr:hypothetical protein DL96DRAFT_1600785 [Flagelloscypha sp. PMI_526]